MVKAIVIVALLVGLGLAGLLFARQVVVNGSGNTVIIGGSRGTGIPGSGVAGKAIRTVGTFHAIRSNSACDIELTTGPATSLVAETDANLLAHFVTRVEDGVLVVEFDTSVSPKCGVKLAVVMPGVDAIEIRGSGTIRASGIATPTFEYTLAGAGNAELSGTTGALTVNLRGAGSVNASGLGAKDAVVVVSGAGNVRVRASGTLDATVSGAGNVMYSGGGGVRSKVTGAGRVAGE